MGNLIDNFEMPSFIRLGIVSVSGWQLLILKRAFLQPPGILNDVILCLFFFCTYSEVLRILKSFS